MSTKTKRIIDKPWSYTVDDMLEKTGTDRANGLPTDEVKKRRHKYGRNLLRQSKRRSAPAIFIDQFKSVIVLVLVAASIISFSFGHNTEGYAVLAVVLVNALIGFFTEFKAARSMEALKKLTSVQANAVRDGSVKKINAADLVPGDLIEFEGGDIVSADIRITEANKLQADESPLTGESTAVDKSTDALDEDTELAERNNMLFNGTSVTKGSGKGVVIATGMATEIGNISELISEAEDEETPLEKRLDSFGRKLIWLTLVLTAVVGLIGYLRGKEFILALETAVALAIAAIPEGLPIVATVALARGMIIMSRKHTLINRLASVETLGTTTTLVVDKTGTLTENKMTVIRYELADGTVNIKDDDKFYREDKETDPEDDELLKLALQTGVLCNNATLTEDEETVGDPLEAALLNAGVKAGYKRDELLNEMPEKREAAFESDTMKMATFNQSGNKLKVMIKGAPEVVIDECTYIFDDTEKREFTDEEKKEWHKKNEALASDGLRVLALAYKEAGSKDDDPYKEMIFVGLTGLLDPPKEGVKDALIKCRKAGINLVMATGDHPFTAENIAKRINLISDKDEGKVIKGKDLKPLDELNENEQKEIAKQKIFARVTPEHKLDIISVLKANGHVVGMTGDGVNDAPALKKADIGVAMGKRGTQVAKEAADMILQDDRLNSIVLAIEEGRSIFRNIRKFVMYLLSGNMGAILSVAAGFLSVAALPLLPLQILYLNFGVDVFPALAIGMGKSVKNIMNDPPRDPGEPILGNKGWFFISLFGLLIAGSVFGAYITAREVLQLDPVQAATIGFLTLGFSRLWHVFNMRNTGTGFFNNEIAKNRFVWYSYLICFVLLIGAVYIPGLSDVLRTHQPDFNGWLLILGASLIPFITGQIIRIAGVKFE